jgi:hypothetical protein
MLPSVDQTAGGFIGTIMAVSTPVDQATVATETTPLDLVVIVDIASNGH